MPPVWPLHQQEEWEETGSDEEGKWSTKQNWTRLLIMSCYELSNVPRLKASAWGAEQLVIP